MQHNKSNLGTRVDEWESAQAGLPEGSEMIWAELERVLESSANKKKRSLPIQWMAAASLILLIGTGLYWYKLSLINQPFPTVVIPDKTKPMFAGSKVKDKKLLSIHRQQINKQPELPKSGSIESVTNSTPPLNSQVPANVHAEVLAVAAIPKFDEKLEGTPINSPVPDTPVTSTNSKALTSGVIYWRKTQVIRKSTNGMPVVHAFEEKHSSNMSVQLLMEERPLPTFEAPPLNDNKPRWKITLQTTNHPNTTGIKE